MAKPSGSKTTSMLVDQQKNGIGAIKGPGRDRKDGLQNLA
jgi:hypothetical protein